MERRSRCAGGGEGRRVVGEAAIFEHGLGIVMSNGGSLDAKVGEHGVRLPAAKKLDGKLVDVRA